ncbi:MAG: DUF726 domain-containing protein [Planctomycetota bacterium]
MPRNRQKSNATRSRTRAGWLHGRPWTGWLHGRRWTGWLAVTLATWTLASPAAGQTVLDTWTSAHHFGGAGHTEPSDRLFLLNLRDQPSDLCRLRLPTRPRISRLDRCGRQQPITWEDFCGTCADDRTLVIYVHGNRMTPRAAIQRGLYVYHNSRPRHSRPLDFLIWSWPSEKQGLLGKDVRLKARRTDGQGLLLADFLRQHGLSGRPVVLIGFSFGGRVITGALHTLAGGSLRGFGLDFGASADGIANPGIQGAGFRVGLIAPAIERDWMTRHGYHGLATKNLESLSVLYNRRDAVLKRYWLIDRVRGQLALGFTGPRRFAPRFDGSPLETFARDCSTVVGLQHAEVDYYTADCRAGEEMARLIASASE